MAGRVIAQMIVSGTTILTKAFFSAYQQALRNAKAGGAPHVSAAAGGAKQLCKMRPDEALKILNIDKDILTKKILDERYKAMFAVNDPAKGGSFYLQSKIYRSKEVLEKEVLMINTEIPPEGAAADATSEPGTGTEDQHKDKDSAKH